MKKVILSIFIALSGIMAVNAQYCYIGGSLDFSGNFSKNDMDSKTHPSYSLSIAPEFGYSINEKTAIGLSVSAILSSSKTSNIGLDTYNNMRVSGLSESTEKNFEIAPYIRYSLFKWGKFDLLGMASVYVSTGKTDVKYEYDSDYYPEVASGMKTLTFGANIHPVLLYNLSKRISLLAHLNLFSLGFWQEKQKNIYDSGGDEYTNNITGYNLGFDTNNVVPAIGFIYKF